MEKKGGVENGWWGVPAIIYFVDKNKTHKKSTQNKENIRRFDITRGRNSDITRGRNTRL